MIANLETIFKIRFNSEELRLLLYGVVKITRVKQFLKEVFPAFSVQKTQLPTLTFMFILAGLHRHRMTGITLETPEVKPLKVKA